MVFWFLVGTMEPRGQPITKNEVTKNQSTSPLHLRPLRNLPGMDDRPPFLGRQMPLDVVPRDGSVRGLRDEPVVDGLGRRPC